MPNIPQSRPSTAERVRTVCARAAGAQVAGFTGVDMAAAVPCPVRHLMADGCFAFSVDRGSPLAAADAACPVVLELLDRDPQAAGDAVRALVWIRGRARPLGRAGAGAEVRDLLDTIAAADPQPGLLDVGHRDTLLVMTVDSVVFADATGAEHVDPVEVLAARPDPFCLAETAWVQHLQHSHPEFVERLRLHLPRRKRQGRIRLLGIDRYGVTVRTDGPQGCSETRVPFFTPVADQAGLSRALRLLMACPFGNGLRPRTAG